MAYVVNIQTGSKKPTKRNPYGNFTRTQSIPLPNKERVRKWIKRNPVGNANTNITIKNTRTKKTSRMKKGTGYYWGRNILNEMMARKK